MEIDSYQDAYESSEAALRSKVISSFSRRGLTVRPNAIEAVLRQLKYEQPHAWLEQIDKIIEHVQEILRRNGERLALRRTPAAHTRRGRPPTPLSAPTRSEPQVRPSTWTK